MTYVEKTDSTLSDFKCTEYTYDDFDNLISSASTSTSDEADVTATYTYNLKGQRTSMTDATGTTNYTYNPFGELTQESKGSIIKSCNWGRV